MRLNIYLLSIFLFLLSVKAEAQHRLSSLQYEKVKEDALKGDKGAQLLLGMHYLSISKTGTYRQKGRKWLKSSADQGLKEAQYEYAKEIYRDKERKTDKIALHYFEKSAKQGHYPAALEAAKMFYFGFGTLRYPNKAYKLFRFCAENNHAEAQYFLSKMYYEGEFIEENKTLAFMWCEKSADQKYPPAQLFLARMYLTGEGTFVDTKKAAELTKEAFENGEKEAEKFWDEKELWRYIN